MLKKQIQKRLATASKRLYETLAEEESRVLVKVAYLLLCHKDPKGIARLANTLTAGGDYVAIHFDKRAPASLSGELVYILRDNANVVLVKDPIKCGWGEWSLVDATLKTLRLAYETFQEATNFYLISGDCRPIKTAEYIHKALTNDSRDYIESFDFFESGWIKTGIRRERLIYRHYLNERKHKRFFYLSLILQQKLGLSRPIPDGLEMMIGSQWWCLRRQSVERLFKFCDSRPDVMRFFATTWIPDETFFQTLIRQVVPAKEIVTDSPTFKVFTDYGLPQVFHNDHLDLLMSQSHFFARKVSPEAKQLTTSLYNLYTKTDVTFKIADDGPKLFTYLTTRGREGRRFGQRFWETDSSLGRDRELLLVVCKKWHVAKRLVRTAQTESGVPFLGYFFNEQDAGQPYMGGLDSSVIKRQRHRRLMARVVFDTLNVSRMGLCADIGQMDLIQDFLSDKANVTLLQIDCTFTDDYIQGHAMRMGLVNAESPPETLVQIVPGLRADLEEERRALIEKDYPRHFRIAQWHDSDRNAAMIARFLDIDHEKAKSIAETPYLFVD